MDPRALKAQNEYKMQSRYIVGLSISSEIVAYKICICAQWSEDVLGRIAF